MCIRDSSDTDVKDARTVGNKRTQKGDAQLSVSKLKTTTVTSGRTTTHKTASVPSLSSSPQQVTINGTQLTF